MHKKLTQVAFCNNKTTKMVHCRVKMWRKATENSCKLVTQIDASIVNKYTRFLIGYL